MSDATQTFDVTAITDKKELDIVASAVEVRIEEPTIFEKIFDDKPLETARRNRLSLLLATLTGKTPQLMSIENRLHPLVENMEKWSETERKPFSIISSQKNLKHNKHITFNLHESANNLLNVTDASSIADEKNVETRVTEITYLFGATDTAVHTPVVKDAISRPEVPSNLYSTIQVINSTHSSSLAKEDNAALQTAQKLSLPTATSKNTSTNTCKTQSAPTFNFKKSIIKTSNRMNTLNSDGNLEHNLYSTYSATSNHNLRFKKSNDTI